MATVTQFGTGTAGNASTVTTGTGSGAIGDLIVVCCGMADPSSITSGMVTDQAGNSYTQIPNTAIRYNSASNRIGMWYSVLTATLTAQTITFNPAVGNTELLIHALKVVTPSASPLDYSGGDANQSTTTPDATTGGTGTGTLGQSDEVAIACWVWKEGGTTFTAPAQNGGWTQPTTTILNATGSETDHMSLAYFESAATTSLNPTCTLNVSSQVAGILSTFKVTAGGGGTTHNQSMTTQVQAI